MTAPASTKAVALALEHDLHDWVLQDFKPAYGQLGGRFASNPRWRAVRDAGTTLWLDTGDLDGIRKLWTREFSALTTNNTLLNKEVQRGIYDDLVKRTAARIRKLVPRISEPDLVLEIAFVLNAYHGLRLVENYDAYVSVEEHTDLAHDVELSVLYAKRFHAICPERFIVKLPLTPAGLLGMYKLGKLGIPVNFTLGFSARQNHLAARLGNPRWVNVFLGRLNSMVADQKFGSGDGVGEKATAASQESIEALRREGLVHTHQIAASMRSGDQVWSLAGVDVMTIPLAAAKEYQDAPRAAVSGRGPVSKDIVPGVEPSALRALRFDRLWDVPKQFRETCSRLAERDLDSMSADELVEHLGRHGAGDLFPDWSEAELDAIRADGKIPKIERWRPEIESGAIGLDTLFNRSGLESFAQDQKALDDRVRGLIG